MNARPTFVLLLLAIGALAFILFFERHAPGTTERGAEARQVVPGLDPARVLAIEIVGTNYFRMEKVRERWMLRNPDYPAQGAFIDDWLRLVSEATQHVHMTSREVLTQPGGLEAFGLADPTMTITIEQPPARWQFRLGARTAIGDRVYLQFVGGDGLVVTDAAILDRLSANPTDWRDRTFLTLLGRNVDAFAVRAGADEYTLERDPARASWRFRSPRPARADGPRVDRALQMLQALRVEGFVEDRPGPDLEPYGLQEPALALTFLSGTNPVVEALFGASLPAAPELVFARRSDYPQVVSVSRRGFEGLAVPYTALLDYRLVDAGPDQLTRVEVAAAESFVLERGTNGIWQVTEPPGFPTDPALVRDALDRLCAVRALETVKAVVSDAELANYGLANPAVRYRMHWGEAAAAPRLDLDFGRVEAERVAARRSDEHTVYGVSLEETLMLPRAALDVRDRRLWQFSTNQVARMTVEWKGEQKTLLRSDTGQWTFAEGSQGMVNTFALEEAVFRLGHLWARAWTAQGEAELANYGFAQVDHRLALELKGDEPRRLEVSFGATSPSGGPFAATSVDGRVTIFEFPLELFFPYQEVIRSMLWSPSVSP